MTKESAHVVTLDDLLDPAGSAVRFGIVAPVDLDGDPSVRFAQLGAAHLEDGALLHNTLFRSLGLPDYYGHNWDALSDVLSDPSWAGDASCVLIVVALGDEISDGSVATLDMLATLAQEADAALRDFDDGLVVRLVVSFGPRPARRP